MFALVDANSFYASAEKVFDPALRRKPVVVLTNNDGCICALCDRAKAIGVKKFGPYHKASQQLARHGAVIRSSNYALYDDLSAKMMQIIGRFAPHQHVYSIDECFLDFGRWQPPQGWKALAATIKDTVYQELRLPVSVGIGLTPTLAKAASFAAKRRLSSPGVAVLANPQVIDTVLTSMSVQDVWGIGKRISARLQTMQIYSAAELAALPVAEARRAFNVEVARTVQELRGIPCLSWDAQRADKRQIFSTRAFGRPVTEAAELRQALAWHGEQVAEKLRCQHSAVKTLTCFAHANPFACKGHYDATRLHTFTLPASDSREIVRAITAQLPALYRQGIKFHKCGVGAIDIVSTKTVQPDLFSQLDKRPDVMACMDAINARYGADTLGLAAKGNQRQWSMKRQFLSPQFTTNWKHIPKILC